MLFEATTNNIRRRVAFVGVILIVAPALAIGLAAWAVLHRIQQIPLAEAPTPVSNAGFSKLAQNLVAVCRNYGQSYLSSLKSGEQILKDLGPVRLDGSHSAVWHATNEITGQPKLLEVPVMSAGSLKFTPPSDDEEAAPAVVEEIEQKAGTPATIFQRLNERGDMLRVASSLRLDDGARAVASFIPADARTGESATILEQVLSGHPYIGQESLYNKNYWTAYTPIYNSRRSVVGMLNTLLPESQFKSQVERVADVRGTQTKAEFFIWQASGAHHGKAVLATDRGLVGRDLWNEKDLSGRFYVQEICRRATKLLPGEFADFQYEKPARIGGIPKSMVAHFAYVPQMNWVVGAAQPDTESLAAVPFSQMIVWAMWLLFGVGVASTGLALRVWIEFTHELAPKLNGLLSHLRKNARQLTAVAVELSHETDRKPSKAAVPSLNVAKPPEPANQKQVDLALQHMNASNQSVAGLIGAIDQIASASNLLTVNAAIEGTDSNKSAESLAALAEQLRLLTQRCRTAAELARSEIEQSRTELEKSRSSTDAATTVQTLRRQTETLARLATGINQTVEIVTTDLGFESDHRP